MNKIDIAKLEDTCNKLFFVAKDLNVMSSLLNQQIELIEAAIKKLNLGITASVPMVAFSELWYKRGKDGWGLYVVTTKESHLGAGEWLLNNSPRYLRIKAIDFIPSLIEQLSQEAESVTIELEDAANRAKEMFKDIK